MGDAGSLKARLMGLGAVRRKTVTFEGVEITLRESPSGVFAEYGQLLRGKDRDVVLANATLIAGSVVDENDQPVLTVAEAMALATNARTAVNIVNEIMQLSGMVDDEDDPEKKADAG